MGIAMYDKIDAYLTQQMTDVQRIAFENEIARNADLKELTVRMQLLRKITQRSRVRSKIIAIHEVKMQEWRQAMLSGPETNEPEVIIEADNIYEEEFYEERKPESWKYVLGTLAVLFLMIGGAFYYMASSPLTIREKPPLAAEQKITLDSLQLAYIDIFDLGIKSMKSKDYLAADSYFKDIVDFQDLPAYYTDAARLFRVETTARQEPSKATVQYKEIFSKCAFGYPYTNKDKLQIWCKIQWAKMMGWK